MSDEHIAPCNLFDVGCTEPVSRAWAIFISIGEVKPKAIVNFHGLSLASCDHHDEETRQRLMDRVWELAGDEPVSATELEQFPDLGAAADWVGTMRDHAVESIGGSEPIGFAHWKAPDPKDDEYEDFGPGL